MHKDTAQAKISLKVLGGLLLLLTLYTYRPVDQTKHKMFFASTGRTSWKKNEIFTGSHRDVLPEFLIEARTQSNKYSEKNIKLLPLLSVLYSINQSIKLYYEM